MLARSHDEIADVDGLLALYADMCRLAVRDYSAGLDAVGPRHFESAERFLEHLGVLDRLPPPPASAGPRQLDLFGGD